jgi:hypothetical protein
MSKSAKNLLLPPTTFLQKQKSKNAKKKVKKRKKKQNLQKTISKICQNSISIYLKKVLTK